DGGRNRKGSPSLGAMAHEIQEVCRTGRQIDPDAIVPQCCGLPPARLAGPADPACHRARGLAVALIIVPSTGKLTLFSVEVRHRRPAAPRASENRRLACQTTPRWRED